MAHSPATPNFAHFKDGECICFNFNQGQAHCSSGDAARAHLTRLEKRLPTRVTAAASLAREEEGFWPAVTGFFSKVWDALTTFVAEIVNGVMRVVYEIAGAVYEFFATLVSDILQVIGLVLEKVFGLTMEKVVDWLGTVFDWEDTQATYYVLKDKTANIVQAIRDRVKTLPDQLESLIGQSDPKRDLALMRDLLPQYQQPIRQAPRDHHDTIASSPAVNWAPQAFAQHAQSAPLPAAVEVMSPILDELRADFAQLKALLVETFTRLGQDYESLSFSQIIEQLTQAATDVVQSLVTMLGALLRKLGDKFADALDTLLHSKWEVPLISQLHRKYVDPNGAGTVLELCCFVLAVPTALATRLITGKSVLELAKKTNLPVRPASAGVNLGAALTHRGATSGSQQVSESAEDALTQLLLGIATGFAQFVSAACYVVIEALRIGGVARDAKILLTSKLVVDSVGYCLSIASMVLRAEHVGLPSGRTKIDIFLASWQGVYRLKDFIRLLTFDVPGSAYWCGVFESLCAVIFYSFLCLDLALQGSESSERRTELLASKGLQYMALGVAQGLSWPREELLELRKAAATKVAQNPGNEAAELALVAAARLEALMVGGRAVLMFIVPAAGWWRSAINFELQRPHVVAS
jgi:hypothetical protein